MIQQIGVRENSGVALGTISSPIQPSYRLCLYFHSSDLLTANQWVSFVSAGSDILIVSSCYRRHVVCVHKSLWICHQDGDLSQNVFFYLMWGCKRCEEANISNGATAQPFDLWRLQLIYEYEKCFSCIHQYFRCAVKENFKVESCSVKQSSGLASFSEGANANTPRPSAGLSLNLGKSSREDNRN